MGEVVADRDSGNGWLLSVSGDVSQVYQIKLCGRLDQRWSEWLGGMMIANEIGADGVYLTTITGPVADQAALRGILWRLWDLNLRLISVNAVKTNDGASQGRE